jgi:small-conductance mechanosensitive channel
MDDAIFPLPQLYWLALELLPHSARGYADVVAELTFAVILGLLARFVIIPLLARAAARNNWPYDDVVVERVRGHVLAWALLGGLYGALEDMPWRPRSIVWGERITATLLALSVTAALMAIVAESVDRAQTRAGGGTTLIKYIINALILIAGVGAALGFFEVSIFPALTALGVGGLAVALAFQDTLANVFAGVNLTAARQIRVGDFVSVDGKTEGFVIDIGWRMTTLRQLDDLLVFIPNKRLGEATMTNFSRPDASMWIDLKFRVALGADPGRVEACVIDELTAARTELPGLRDDAPLIRLREIAPSALEYSAHVAITNFVDRSPLRSRLLTRLLLRLRREGLEIPLPRQIVELQRSDIQ